MLPIESTPIRPNRHLPATIQAAGTAIDTLCPEGNPVADKSQTRQAEPPAGGWQDHDAMRAAAMRPVTGPASTDALAATGGLNMPGGDPIAASTIDVPTVAPVHEPIPGEYDRTTLTHREPGAMGTRFGDATPSPDTHNWLDDETAHDRMLEGGGHH
jgi:hypothetical protein